MNASKSTGEYMLFFRGADWDQALSTEELQAAMEKIEAWFGKLNQQGKIKGAQPLGNERKLVFGDQGRIVADGPFAESKEAIGGYLLVEADDLEAALAIAKASPSLEYGVSIEVRPVLGECPIRQRLKERAALSITAGQALATA